eukprot:m.212730 g.212730  ORF g.212730 m.212730 type:complete len:525 (-) comp26160_c0_seq4:76-1650(-)
MLMKVSLLTVLGLVMRLTLAANMNVLFFAVDDLRPQLGCMGVSGTPKMLTPNLDDFASRSLLLKKAEVSQAVCSPSRTSFLTSRYPDITRVWDLYSYFRDVGGNYTTIPQYFKEAGYLTIGMGKIFHPGHASGYNKTAGRKGDDQKYSWSTPYWHAPNLGYWSGPNTSWYAVPEIEQKHRELPDVQIADRAVETIESFKKNLTGNFFLGVGFHKPHLPFVFPESFLDLYPSDEIHLPENPYAPNHMPSVAWSAYGELRSYHDIAKLNASGAINTTLPDQVVKDLRRAYYSAVSYTDAQIGRVLKALEDNGFADNTVITFVGDHGWQLGEHGEWCKHTNFELATNAPMIVHVPGRTDSGIVSEQPVEYVDLMPTVIEAAMNKSVPFCPPGSYNVKTCTNGVSLIPLIANPDKPVKEAAFSQYPRGLKKPSLHDYLANIKSTPTPSACLKKGCTMGYSLLTNYGGIEYRYTEWIEFVNFQREWDNLVGRELYDHQNDPNENVNVAGYETKADVVAALSKMLRAHVA